MDFLKFLFLFFLKIKRAEQSGAVDCMQNPATGNCFSIGSEKFKDQAEATEICYNKNSFLPILLYPSDTEFLVDRINYREYAIGARKIKDGCSSGPFEVKPFVGSFFFFKK